MIEAMLFGELTTAQASSWLESLDVGTLTAVAKASIQFSKYCQIWIGLYDGIGVRAMPEKLRSKPLDQILDIGGLSWVSPPGVANSSVKTGMFDIGDIKVSSKARSDRVKTLAISVKEAGLFFQGRALVQPFGESLYGELKVYPKTWQGIISRADFLQPLYGLFQDGNNPVFKTQTTLSREPKHPFGFVGIGAVFFLGKPATDITIPLEAGLSFSSHAYGVGTTTLEVKHLRSLMKNYNLFTKTLISKAADVKHPKGGPIVIQDGSRGYIDVTITKTVAGNIGFDLFVRGGSVTFFGERIKSLFVSSLEGIEANAHAEIKEAKSVSCMLKICSESITSMPEKIPSVSAKSFSRMGGLLYRNILRVRDGESVLAPGLIIPFTDGMGVGAIVSYQKRKGTYGSMPVKTKTAIEPVVDSVVVLTYEIVYDDEEGEIYEIQTKYHKDNEGVALMGWRYFNELIE